MKLLRNLFPFSLGAKIFISFFMATTLLTIGLCAVAIQNQKELLEKKAVSQSMTTASLLAGNLRLAVFSEDREAIRYISETALEASDTEAVAVLDRTLAQLALSGKKSSALAGRNLSGGFRIDPEGRLAPEAELEALLADYFYSSTPILTKPAASSDDLPIELGSAQGTEKRLLGYVVVFTPKSGFLAEYRSLAVQALGMALAFLALALAATYFLVASATKPLKRLLESLRERNEILSGRGDMEVLDASYNQLVADLDSSIARISSFNKELEEKVKEATLELSKANEDLEGRVRERTRDLEETYKKLIHSTKFNAAGKLVASIAHEINSPLCVINFILDDAKRQTAPDSSVREMLEVVMKECARVGGLVERLRHYTNAPTGLRKTFNLKELIESVVLLHARPLRKRNIRVECGYSSDELLMVGDIDQLQQVFMNLVQNASEAIIAEEGGLIRITAEESQGNFTVIIEDNGIGIPKDEIDRIVEPFYTTKDEVKGTGLGLSISLGIVKAHGGDISFESEPGATRVIVRLPICMNFGEN